MNYGKQHTDGSRSGGQPVTEPAWIEHDGSAVCPVPADYRVQVSMKMGGVIEARAYTLKWDSNIVGYRVIRPLTAFAKEQEAMGEDVPKWAMRKALQLGEDYPNEGWVNTFARYIAAHEQPPVDWLRRVLDEAGNECGIHISEDYVAAIRARIPNIDSLAAAGGGE